MGISRLYILLFLYKYVFFFIKLLQFFVNTYIFFFIYIQYIKRDYVNSSRRRPTENSRVPPSIVAVKTCREKNIL